MSSRRREGQQEPDFEIPHDPANEQVVLAAAIVDAEARRWLAGRVRPEHFLVEEHRHAWEAVLEVERRGLGYDHELAKQLSAGRARPDYLAMLAELRPEAPDRPNLEHHVASLFWDRQRALAVRGPLGDLLAALRNPAEPPERVRALAGGVAASLQGAGDGYLCEPAHLVAGVVEDLRRRVGGRACWPYGLPGLDFYEQGATDSKGEDIGGRHRMLPGAAPGMMTVVTAVSGGGKSALSAHLALGLAEQGRRVLYGAWEPGSPMTLELLACIRLGYNRTDVTEGAYGHEDIVALEEKMHELSKGIVFMENPFQRRVDDHESNERNQDLIQQHIVDSRCDAFFADMWEYCLVDDRPGAEKRALWRQKAMAKETRTHHFLLGQQRVKDVETRVDKRPTREGIMGSTAWVTAADNILAPHRPALFQRVADDKMEVIVWKQRWGRWPQCVEFDWDPEYGSLSGGRTIPFEHIGEQAGELEGFRAPASSGKRGKRRRW